MTTQIRTALIVDDEAQLLRLLTRVLERADYTVWAAATASEAMRLFEEHADDFDLAVLDVIMPDGGAATLLPGLWDRRPDLHVILTSGDALPLELETLLATGVGQFLRKPFVPKSLLRMISEGEAGETPSVGDAGRVLPGRA